LEKEFDFKSIVDLIPIFSAWSIIYTCTGLYSYYHGFHIDIFSYIDVGELILISLSKFVLTIIALFIFFFLSVLHPFQNFFDGKDQLDAGHTSNIKLYSYPFYFALVFAIALFGLDYNNQLLEIFKKIKWFCVAWVILNLPIYISLCYIYIRKEKKQLLTVVLIFFFFYSCNISFLLGYIDKEAIKKNPLGNSIVFNGRIVKSTRHYYFIGQTKNYVFFHNDICSCTDIYPSQSISKLSLK
jgi:hypothetical protein